MEIVTPYILPNSKTNNGKVDAVIFNPTNHEVTNLKYSIDTNIASGSEVIIESSSIEQCSRIKAYSSCRLTLEITKGSTSGAFNISISNGQLSSSKKSTATKTSLLIGIQPTIQNSYTGPNGIIIYYYNKILNSNKYIIVSGIVGSSNSGILNQITLVDKNNQPLPDQYPISNNLINHQQLQLGDTFSIMMTLPQALQELDFKIQTSEVSTTDEISNIQTGSVQYQLKAVANEAILFSYPAVLNLTEEYPSLPLALANIGNQEATQLALLSNSPNIVIQFTTGNLLPYEYGLAQITLTPPDVPATLTSLTTIYNNGQNIVEEKIPVTENITPTPTPTPSPTPVPTPTPTPTVSATLSSKSDGTPEINSISNATVFYAVFNLSTQTAIGTQTYQINSLPSNMHFINGNSCQLSFVSPSCYIAINSGTLAGSYILSFSTTGGISPTPASADITVFLNTVNIQSAFYQTSALNTSSAPYWWGWTISSSQANPDLVPETVNTNMKFSTISSRYGHVCGINIADNLTYCWGNGKDGSLGLPNNNNQAFPTSPVQGNHTFTDISAGYRQSCGIDTNNNGWCWGKNNCGQLGNGQVPTEGLYSSIPQSVIGNHQFLTISAGQYFSCGIDNSGTAWCWGAQYGGDLGNGQNSEQYLSSPQQVLSGATKFQMIVTSGASSYGPSNPSCGSGHTCAIDTTGKAWCWGINSTGQLGNNTLNNSSTPQSVYSTRKFIDITAGSNYTCAVDTTYHAWCWGNNEYGQLGINQQGNYKTTPQIVEGITNQDETTRRYKSKTHK